MGMNRKKRFLISLMAIPLLLAGLLAALTYRAAMQERRSEALVRAIHYNDTVAVLKLLEEGADPNVLDTTGRPKLSFFQHMLLEINGDAEDKESPPDPALFVMLNSAMQKNKQGRIARVPYYPENTVIVKALLEHGADSNAHNFLGMSVLMMAALAGYDDTVRLLLDHGANPNAIAVGGGTPLAFARGKCVETLIAYGADVNYEDKRSSAPLICACERGDVVAIRALLAHGAKINVQDEAGYTPLMWAVQSGNLPGVQAVLAAGADYKIKDQKGQTVLQQAVRDAKTSIVTLLKQAGAKE